MPHVETTKDQHESSQGNGFAARLLDRAGRWLHAQFFRVEYRIDRRFDQRAGIETLGSVHADDLTIDSDHTDFGDDETIYVGIPVLALADLRRQLPDDLSDFVFVDYGSGKGRVVCWATTLNVRRVIGVEFASELHEIATANVANLKHPDQQCRDVEVIHADATELELPDEPCILYFFNPFEDEVLRKVVAQIDRSHRANPRPMYIWYHNPRHADIFRTLDDFTEVWSRTSSRRSECYEAVLFASRSAGR